MRPRLITLPKILLFLVACGVVGGMVWWTRAGKPLPGSGVPSTAGKIAFISDRNGHNDLFFMGADGKDAPVALTNDEADDNEPTWSATGSEIAFTSASRKGVSPQVFIMDALPQAKVLPVTNTSPTKEQPHFGAEGRIYYLDAGKLNAADATADDFDALFPGPDMRLALTGLFSTGGLARAVVSPDGTRILAVLKGEEAQVLLLYEREGDRLAILGAGAKIYPAFRPDGGWVAAFADGGPTQEPALILSDELMQRPDFAPPGPLPAKPQPGLNLLASWDKTGKPEPPSRLPAPARAAAVSPDGTKIALCFGAPDKNQPIDAGGEQPPLRVAGLVIAPLGAAGSVVPVFAEPTSEPSWSPEGGQIAFVSGSDIYVAAADGSGTPQNLTQGKGNNFAPAWSPAAAKK